MNTSYHPYSDISSPHQHNSPSPDNKFSPILVGYRNGIINRGLCAESNVDLHSPHLTFMDDMTSDYHHHQRIVNTNNSQKICAGCEEKISDRFLLHALDRFWHNSCLKCHCCGTMLADIGSSCFTRRGLILCKKDYSSMFGCSGICSGCGETIPPSEMIAKAIPTLNQQTSKSFENQKAKQPLICVFHLKCFTCTKCGANLQPGDRYTMLGANLVCEQDWQKLLKNTSTTNGPLPSARKGKVGRPRRNKE